MCTQLVDDAAAGDEGLDRHLLLGELPEPVGGLGHQVLPDLARGLVGDEQVVRRHWRVPVHDVGDQQGAPGAHRLGGGEPQRRVLLHRVADKH